MIIQPSVRTRSRSLVIVLWEGDEKALVPERTPYMWWLGLCPNHHIYGSLLRARGILVTLLRETGKE
jgi:hypothetical protein